MLKIHRYEVPVDGRWHNLPLNGKITHIGPHDVRNDVVNVWAVHDDSPEAHEHIGDGRRFRVFATGEPLPKNTRPENILGSARTTDGRHVWHLVDTWYPGNE